MAVRDLTANETAVLAHVTIDPIDWWQHVNSVAKIDSEAALAAKVARYQQDYDEAVERDGDDYKTAAEDFATAEPVPALA